MKKRISSSPIGHPSAKRAVIEKVEAQNYQVRQNMAHLGLSVYAPGGDNNLNQMRAQLVKKHTTGKRWYVSYYTTSPSGKNIRRRAYGYVNTETDLTKKAALLDELAERVLKFLLDGKDILEQPVDQVYNIYIYTNRMLSDKKPYLKTTAYNSIRRKLEPFKKWLLHSNNNIKHPAAITKVDMLNYRNWLLMGKITNRTINNYMDEARALFNYLIKLEENIVVRNPCANIERLPSQSESHVRYSAEQIQEIAKYCDEKDKPLGLMIRLIYYSFLRVKEARTLQLKDIDFDSMKIILPAAKSKVNKKQIKQIPDAFKPYFMALKLHEYPKEFYLFGKHGKPGPTHVGETFFIKRFKKVKKRMGLTRHHTLYGFRHSAVSWLALSGATNAEIMANTGHTQLSSFQNYMRSVVGEEAKDLSHMYKAAI